MSAIAARHSPIGMSSPTLGQHGRPPPMLHPLDARAAAEGVLQEMHAAPASDEFSRMRHGQNRRGEESRPRSTQRKTRLDPAGSYRSARRPEKSNGPRESVDPNLDRASLGTRAPPAGEAAADRRSGNRRHATR